MSAGNIHLKFFQLGLGLLFLLPIFPFAFYWDWAWTSWSVVILIFGITIIRKVRWSSDWTSIGFIFFGGVIIFHFIGECLREGVLPTTPQYLVFGLFTYTYFFLRTVWTENTSFPLITSRLAFICLWSLIGYLWVQTTFWGMDYFRLEAHLGTRISFGSISQLAMYLSFYLLLISSWGKSSNALVLSCIVSFYAATLLHSKLLAIVSALMLGDYLLRKLNSSLKNFILSSILFSSAIFTLLAKPSMLIGRTNLALLTWQNQSDFLPFGLGLGTFNRFTNQVFISQKSINNVGEIRDLAFNDFSQIFVELGLFGGIAFGVIILSLLKPEKLYHWLALILIIGFMFPIQHIESGLLFLLVSLTFQSDEKTDIVRNKKTQDFYNRLGYLLAKVGVGLLVFYGLVLSSRYHKWYAQLNNTNTELNLLVPIPALSKNDKYLLDFANYLYRSGKFKKADHYYGKAFAKNPSYQIVIGQADCAYKLGKYNVATKYYKQAELIRPQHLYPVYRQIFCTWHTKGYEEAKEYWIQQKEYYQTRKGVQMNQMFAELDTLFDMS